MQRRARSGSASWCLCALAAVSGCNVEASPERYDIALRVEAGPGETLAGARAFLGKSLLGTSNENGRLELTVEGREGSTAHFGIECPEGFTPPAEPVRVPLRRSSRVPEYDVRCSASKRTLVVAVRAVNGPNLPVLYLGNVVARTDSTGTAHVRLSTSPTEVVQLTLDTSAEPQLKPQNPSANFELSGRDRLLTFGYEFVVDKPKRGVVRPRRRGPDGPFRIN
jgi:hypothetical protein